MQLTDLKGFTLFELIVVLVIVGMITSIVAPRLVNSLGNMNAKSAAKKIAASLRYARSKAASEKIPYVSVFDFYANQLIIKKYIDDKEVIKENLTKDGMAKIYSLPEDVHLKKGISGSDEIFRSEPFYIIFYPGGGSSGGEISISDARERELTVKVDFITGIVQLSE